MAATELINGLVLAGGRSRRMGRDKALLRVAGETQLSRAVHLLEPFVDQVFVSVRADQADEPERSRFRRIVDRYRDIGPVAGILTATEAEPQAGWLVLACDLPNIDAATVRYLLDKRSAEHRFTAFRSSYDGLPEPLCAFYAAGAADTIRSFVDDGIICPRKILIAADAQLLEQPSPEALDNINTPEDLARVRLEVAP